MLKLRGDNVERFIFLSLGLVRLDGFYSVNEDNVGWFTSGGDVEGSSVGRFWYYG